MRIRTLLIAACLLVAAVANAFFEDVCLPRRKGQGTLTWCIKPTCPSRTDPNRACPEQLVDFLNVMPGRSMVHADSTYFIAQALGYRPDVAYWIAAYNEVTDYTQYVPIDQCGVQATSSNSGKNYITAQFNGFQRTNNSTDGPLDHYVVNFSPNGQGTDVHGAMGVQSLYPLYYPRPGYPLRIDDTYQKTLANIRQWAMIPTNDPGVLCTVGLLNSDGTGCLNGLTITGTVPAFTKAGAPGPPINAASGKKILNLDANTGAIDYYEKLQSYLDDTGKTTGTLWLSPSPGPVPLQVARIGIWLHVMQDTSSHSTYCGDDAPTPPGGCDPGTFMSIVGDQVKVSFGNSCATGPHLAGHVQETGTNTNPLPLRDYVALNNTVDELINFGNQVALKYPGWIVNPELLPPDVVGGKSRQGFSADDLKATLVGKIASGTPYSRAEVYQSGVVTLPLQQTNALDRLHAMNAALGNYSQTVQKQSANPSAFRAFQPMPGNSFLKDDTSVCWK